MTTIMQAGRLSVLTLLLAFALCSGGVPPAAAQAPSPPHEVEVPPVECWWKADPGAVRLGERFSLVLTCALLQTAHVRVDVDESRLAPTSLRLPPFEVIEGERFRDVEREPWRFLQYRYAVRVLGEDLFGRDVAMPRLQLTYRVSNALATGAVLAGLEQPYWLPPLAIRVLSLVPREADDIRDVMPASFAAVEARRFRAHLLLIVAGVTLASALVLAGVLVTRTSRRRLTARGAAPTAVSAAHVLWAVSRELRRVEVAARTGWDPALTGRAAAAVRLAAAVALSRPVAQREVPPGTSPREGELVTRRGWRRRALALSAAVTPATTAAVGAGSRKLAAWEALRAALARFSTGCYGRQPELDSADLDAALAEGRRRVGQLQRHLLCRPSRGRRATEDDRTTPAWAR